MLLQKKWCRSYNEQTPHQLTYQKQVKKKRQV